MKSVCHICYVIHICMSYIYLELRLLCCQHTLRKKCPNSELFWLVFSRIQTEYGEIRSISTYLVRMWENMDQNNSEYGLFSRSDILHLRLPFATTSSESQIVQ